MSTQFPTDMKGKRSGYYNTISVIFTIVSNHQKPGGVKTQNPNNEGTIWQ